MIVPKPAATLVLVRDEADDLAVLMLRRNLASKWVGGVHLFPGGAVDEADAELALAGRTTGRSEGEASRLLGVGQDGLSYFVAALRECFEEAGVLLARREDGPFDGSEPGTRGRLVAARGRLNAGEQSFSSFLAEEGLLLDVGRLFYFAHWITPEGSPRRYDTRFFVAAAPAGQEALHDDVEVIESAWLRPGDALARHRAGEIDMLLPTAKNLEAVGRFSSTAELLAAVSSLEVKPVLPKVVEAEQGVRILLPGDEGYTTGRAAPEGAAFPDRSS